MSDLEALSSENILILSPDNKKVNKRRSSGFQRQSLVRKDQDLETSNFVEEISHESKKFKASNDYEQETFDIKAYIDNLKKEDKNWHEECLKRKSQTQQLLKRDRKRELTQTVDITCLSDSERAFLSMKPDYDEFNSSLCQLHMMATKVVYLNLCSENFCSKSFSKLKNDLDNAKYRIINLLE